MKYTDNFIKNIVKTTFITVSVFVLASCGGGSGNSESSVNTGQFKDSNVEGIQYSTASQFGVTNSLGEFSYKTGEIVTFTAGDVVIGTAMGASVLSPAELGGDGSSGTKTINISRLLQALDDDDDPNNGIILSSTKTTVIDTRIFDFSDNETFNTIDDQSITVPSIASATAHIQNTLSCAYSGAYIGEYIGGTRGRFAALIGYSNSTRTVQLAYHNTDLDTGEISNKGTITDYGMDTRFTATTTIGASTINTITFAAGLDSPNSISGTWNDTSGGGYTGTFAGMRVGGARNAVNRYTTAFSSTAIPVERGVMTFDLTSNYEVTGVAYSTTYGELNTFSGTYNTNTNTINVDFTDVNSSATAIVNISNGEITGTWNTGNTSGELSGFGCTLNPVKSITIIP